jgi:site-specific DNA-methyltransferase (adenine-specific)/modification methylase
MRTERIGNATLYLGDCHEVMHDLGTFDALVTDPPYGMKWDGKVTVGANGHGKRSAKSANFGETILGDDRPFDPSHLLSSRPTVIWGFNHFPDKLRRGRCLVWLKRRDAAFGSYLSDAVIAWCSEGHGVFCQRDPTRMAETLERHHPSQKPVGGMVWAIQNLPKTVETILDPYMGSGTTGVACHKMGRRFVGIERMEKYFDIACRRIEEAQRQPDLLIQAGAA